VRQNTASSCSQLLEKASLPVLERARKLARLEKAVLNLLPADLRAHCKVLNLKNETLVLATHSPAWAGRLRFAAPELCKQLECQYSLAVPRVDIRIHPLAIEKTQSKQPSMRISGTNATLLAQTAESISHTALREALYRLAAKTGVF
jgi:hypothetical protein